MEYEVKYEMEHIEALETNQEWNSRNKRGLHHLKETAEKFQNLLKIAVQDIQEKISNHQSKKAGKHLHQERDAKGLHFHSWPQGIYQHNTKRKMLLARVMSRLVISNKHERDRRR